MKHENKKKKFEMSFSEEDVFSMVDALFHMYASSYRTEAKDTLRDMIDSRAKRNE